MHNRSAMVTALMIGFEPTYHSLTVSRFANQPHENILPTSERACRIDITNAIDEHIQLLVTESIAYLLGMIPS